MTPALRLLHEKGAEVDVVVRAGCEAVLEGNPHVARVLTVPRGGALGAVFGRRYDYAFDLSNSDRAKLLIAASLARVRAINAWHAGLGWKRVFFNRLTHFEWAREHQVMRDWRAVADVVGGGNPGPLVLNTDVEVEAPAGAYAVIHPVSRWKFKQWRPERWAAVADALPFPAVLTCGPGEDAEVEKILSLAKKQHQRAKPMKLRQLGRLIRGAQLFLGVDTVAMHVAAAVQTPSVALFGPSSEWSWRPWLAPHQLVLGECSCKATRRFVCDKSRPYPCMEAIAVEAVSAAAASLLRAAPARTPRVSADR